MAYLPLLTRSQKRALYLIRCALKQLNKLIISFFSLASLQFKVLVQFSNLLHELIKYLCLYLLSYRSFILNLLSQTRQRFFNMRLEFWISLVSVELIGDFFRKTVNLARDFIEKPSIAFLSFLPTKWLRQNQSTAGLLPSQWFQSILYSFFLIA